MFGTKPRLLAAIRPEKVLAFKGQGQYPPTAWIAITNCSDERVAFKIKTTSPAGYDVKYHRGLLKAKASIAIPIVLKKVGECSVAHDKFSVLVMRVGEEKIRSKAELKRKWQHAAIDSDPDVLIERRLRCTFNAHVRRRSGSRRNHRGAVLCCCDDEEETEDVDCQDIFLTPTLAEDECEHAIEEVVDSHRGLKSRVKLLSRANILTIATVLFIVFLLILLRFAPFTQPYRVLFGIESCEATEYSISRWIANFFLP